MGGLFSIGGLVSGLDSNSIIEQLLALERQPIVRAQSRITLLGKQKETLRDFRTQLLSFRNLVQDFRTQEPFGKFGATSSLDTVLGASISGSNPTSGSFSVEVLQLASSSTAQSSSRLGASINPAAALNSSGLFTTISGETFTINGVELTVDADVLSLNDVLFGINSSSAGVTATYDALTDTITIENSTPGDTSIINFGASTDTSNLLAALNVRNATQVTGGNGSTTVTSSVNLGAAKQGDFLNAVNFAGGPVTSGSFRINGVTINIDVAADALSDVVARINSSDAGVVASVDTGSDSIRVVSSTLGSRTIDFTSATSNFLDIVNLTTATQTVGNDSQFRVDGGAIQTRNTNSLSDVIGGVTLNLLSTGTSSVTVERNNEDLVEEVKGLLTAYNETVSKVRELTGRDGELRNDSTIQTVAAFLRQNIFSRVTGVNGLFNSLADIGISTGSAFDSTAVSQLEIDEEAFLEAIGDDRLNVESLFANDGETGIFDQFFTYLDGVTGIESALNFRAKASGSIDQQVSGLNLQIERLEERLGQKEARLRQQFARLEQLSATFQAQAGILGGLSSSFRRV